MQGMFKVSKDISRLQGKHIAGIEPEYFIGEAFRIQRSMIKTQ